MKRIGTNVEVTVDLRRLEKNIKKAQVVLDTKVVQDTDEYVPMQSGFLKGSVRNSIGTGELLWVGPYAHYLYEGKLMVSPTTGSSWANKNETKIYADKPLTYYQENPKAGAEWFQRSKNTNAKRWIDAVKKIAGGE
jgi:hypothetical protein